MIQSKLRRRDLAKTAMFGIAAAAAIPALEARAAEANADENILFTAKDPAHWTGKEATHAPVATVSGATLTIKTPHPMTEEHFIVSHTVVLAGGKYLSRKTFTPKDTEAASTHTLPDSYKGVVTVTSACNLHDLWVSTITV